MDSSYQFGEEDYSKKSDDELVNILIMYLYKYKGEWVSTIDLYIEHQIDIDRSHVINAKTIETKFAVDDGDEEFPSLKMSPFGLLQIDKYKSYTNYLNYLDKQQQESIKKKEELDKLNFEKLNLEIEDLRNKFFDYDKTKSRTKRSELYAIIAIIVSIIAILPLLCDSNG